MSGGQPAADRWLEQGESLMQQARSGSQSRMKGPASTAELFLRAAKAFQMGRHWRQAGEAFSELAELSKSAGRVRDAAKGLADAANCYRKVDTQKALEYLQEAIQVSTGVGEFTTAAKCHVAVGEINEENVGNLELAAENFEQAAEYFGKDSSNISASNCGAKAARLCADYGNFAKAAQLFEKQGRMAMHRKFLNYSAKCHFFNACLCHLSNVSVGVPNCQQALQEFAELNPPFAESREYQLLLKLVEAANPDKPDARAFTAAVDEYKETSRLQPWTEARLNSIKKALRPKQPELT